MAGEDPSLEGEVQEQIASVEQRLAELEEQRLFSGRYDSGDALVTVNAGAGGTDAQDWAEMVLRMLMRWAEGRGFKVELLEVSEGEEAGIKSATFRASGENAYGLFGAERGVHRLVRLSPFDSAHRRQTSFAGVEVAPVVKDTGEIEINEDDLQVDTYRASGAGGQHVNKTDSAVRITHRPTGIVVQCQNERSQSSNRATAMAMLRAKLLERKERERQEEIAREKGEAQDVNFGSQIRSYVLHPYSMVKDHRTGYEMGDVNACPRRRPGRLRAGLPALRGDRSRRARHGRRSASWSAARPGGGRGRRRRDDAGHRRARARGHAPDHPEGPGSHLRPGCRRGGVPQLDPDAALRADGGGGSLARAGRPVLRAEGLARALLTGGAHGAELPGAPLRRRDGGGAGGRERSRARARGSWTRARPRPGCGRWRRRRWRRAARVNHRAGLYDAILIKENHIAAAGGSPRRSSGRGRPRRSWRARSRSRFATARRSTRRSPRARAAAAGQHGPRQLRAAVAGGRQGASSRPAAG